MMMKINENVRDIRILSNSFGLLSDNHSREFLALQSSTYVMRSEIEDLYSVVYILVRLTVQKYNSPAPLLFSLTG